MGRGYRIPALLKQVDLLSKEKTGMLEPKSGIRRLFKKSGDYNGILSGQDISVSLRAGG